MMKCCGRENMSRLFITMSGTNSANGMMIQAGVAISCHIDAVGFRCENTAMYPPNATVIKNRF
jgi:hypothetical protein